ncbi:hypothetical protein LTR20_002887 [Exophiala xenobiotica]|nr:hypothetical protein LTS13_000472 [Exophiala xenobiotica]KAK5403609.1 hypothetical protein LTR79_000362 [Exophiala xenobiotica]KAK5423098.1 hypothetical protein LTR90_002116 [Exophiala xenobiotica]KAK5468541.1 hypothetical protein LTR20_002887 [Exophiala xenobiotica]KAK5495624.1 hypothetical protein LTR26_002240 [Exophiala xenobiotica]
MASTEKAKKQMILPPDAFEYLNSIKLLQPELLESWKHPKSFDDSHYIPPPSHRVMIDKLKSECERIVSWIKNEYAGFPRYRDGCFKELLQWLHRFDFTQDDEMVFNTFLAKIMGEHTPPDTPIFQTQTHEFFLVMGDEYIPGLRRMNAANENKPSITEIESGKFMKLIHEFKPALQVERDSDTEERVLPLRFGLPMGKVICFEKGKPGRRRDKYLVVGYTSFHLVFHPIDKSFWMVVDRYMDWDGQDILDDDEPVYQTNEELKRTLRYRFGKGNDIVMAEAFRLGSKDLWFPQELGLSEREKPARQLDGGVGIDGNKSEEPVSRYTCRDTPPTIEFSSLPKVSLFRTRDPPQVHFATHTGFQSYLVENGVVKGRSWVKKEQMFFVHFKQIKWKFEVPTTSTLEVVFHIPRPGINALKHFT